MRIKADFWKNQDRICWLCVLMQEFVGTDSLQRAPAILSGAASVINAPGLKNARQAIFNMRQMSLAYVTEQSVKYAVAIYNDYHYTNKTQGTYKIDAKNLKFERTDPFEDPNIARARKILAAPMEYQKYSPRMADPRQQMAVSLGEQATNVRIPISPIDTPLAERRNHDLSRKPRGKIRIPLGELQALAAEMDAREEQDPLHRKGNWAERFERFMLMAPEVGKGLKEEDTLELEGIKHLIGLPGSGKTTILVLTAIWLARRGYKAMFVFPSIEVSRQYMDILQFHEVKVGMLVGQSNETRRRHADNIAEAIAAIGGNGGFAHTLGVADIFSLNCVLPAFSTADTSMWGFGYAPCREILQGTDKNGKMKKCLCPLWTMCGRNKAARELPEANIWVGHIRSMDTQVPAHAIQEEIRYFELIARTFDLVVFDEADMVQSSLDSYGAANLSISGSEQSIHLKIQEQIHNPFARGENHRLADRDIELYSRDLAEFGNHSTSLMTVVQNMTSSGVGGRYENQLLTVFRLVSDLLYKFDISKRNSLDEKEVKLGLDRSRALKDLWETAAYNAFYDRTATKAQKWSKSALSASILELEQDFLEEQWRTLIKHFRRYLAENMIEPRDRIVEEISELFLILCFPGDQTSQEKLDVIKLLISITFVILSYQRIIPGTRTMVAEGVIRDPIVTATTTPGLRRMIPENLLGSLSGVKYSFRKAQTTRKNSRNVELSYIAFVGSPRMLMHRFHRLLEADGDRPGPAVLMTSATSFLEASPAYHINVGPDYLLKPRKNEVAKSEYSFKWFPDREQGEPLRYSGGGELRDRNLERMVDALVRGGTTRSEIYKSINYFDNRDGVKRKAALVVNSYDQARNIKKFLDDHHRDVGRRTKAVVNFLRDGEKPSDFVTVAQCEALGDDETCDIIIFPMLGIGRGVNIVFTKGARKLDAAIGSIYFLTRPHPTTDDMQLLYSLAGRATQEFDSLSFNEEDDLNAIAEKWQQAKKDLWHDANRLLKEPLMASRLGPNLFKPFTANQMVAILQTIGRGMRNGCPVRVYFVDAAWAIQSTKDKPDSGRNSMLVQMRIILEECVKHPDPAIREVYQELYGAFLEPLRCVRGVKYPKELRSSEEMLDYSEFDDSPLMEL